MRRYSTVELMVRPKAPGYVITFKDRRQPLATVVSDAKYPGMWRVVDKSGTSDMVNLSRAIDAAMVRTVNILNKDIITAPTTGA